MYHLVRCSLAPLPPGVCACAWPSPRGVGVWGYTPKGSGASPFP
nr:MAG TPA: hypothetical protein [Caudoviricetes sp.]